MALLREGLRALIQREAALLYLGQVWTHPVVIGALAAGQLMQREEIHLQLQKLPRGDELDLGEGLHLIAE